eukprot:TCALIF_01776-PA protein Name:"Similar to Cmtm4 CKLF-like MARVEL transmembrane domain-containing protein 4 (Mus musculus)" AED:0.70 eAED:0.74 QI:0/0/0/0.37/1/1/8/0/373
MSFISRRKTKMPVTVELKYESIINNWGGRIKLIELVLAMLCMCCCAPSYTSTQTWFLVVVVFCFLGTIFFSLFYLCLDVYLKGVNINWLQTEFWFTALATFLYFTAFIAQLVAFAGEVDAVYQYWVDAQVAAGVFGLFNDVAYGVGTYFLYLEWKANPSVYQHINTYRGLFKPMEGDEERASLWNGDHLKSRNGLHQMAQILLILVSGGFGFGAKCNDISTRSNINELLLLLSLIWVLLVLTFAFELANLPHEIKYIRERRSLYDKIVSLALSYHVPPTHNDAILQIDSFPNNTKLICDLKRQLSRWCQNQCIYPIRIFTQRGGKRIESMETGEYSSESGSDPCDPDDLEDFDQDPPPFRVTLTRNSTINSDD